VKTDHGIREAVMEKLLAHVRMIERKIFGDSKSDHEDW
jgi:hypothetical protein